MAAQPPAPEELVEEAPSEPLKYKTWSLKVSVHCEGCKRKVKRILLGTEGVYTVDVDTKLHKATVTGNVDPETLIRKLEKSGKHAELWPEKTEQKESKRSKKKKNKQNDQDASENGNNDDSLATEPENPEPNKGEAAGPPPPPSKVVEVVSSGKPGSNVQFREVRVETNRPENQPAGDKPPEAAPNGANAGGGGGGKKKKKKKGGNSNGGAEPATNGNCNGNGEDGAPQAQPAAQGQGPPAEFRSPPRSYPPPAYEHPMPPYYGPPPVTTPVYAVSYNTAYPSSSYTASFYANPAPYSYAYMHRGSDSGESDVSPSDSFEIFSDENPNACSVM